MVAEEDACADGHELEGATECRRDAPIRPAPAVVAHGQAQATAERTHPGLVAGEPPRAAGQRRQQQQREVSDLRVKGGEVLRRQRGRDHLSTVVEAGLRSRLCVFLDRKSHLAEQYLGVQAGPLAC